MTRINLKYMVNDFVAVHKEGWTSEIPFWIDKGQHVFKNQERGVFQLQGTCFDV